MFEEVRPSLLNADAYASVDDLLTLDDLIEQDVTIKRWHRNGRALKLRLKAMNLEQQDAIYEASLRKNKKTELWETHRPTFCAHSLVQLVKVPALDLAQAQALVRKNPNVIDALVNFGWALSAFDTASLEEAALALAPADESRAAGAE